MSKIFSLKIMLPLSLSLLCLFGYMPLIASADSGWYSSIVAGETNTSCGNGYARYQFVLSELNTRTPIANATGIQITLNVKDWDTYGQVGAPVVSQDRAISNSICFNPMTQIVVADVDYTNANPRYHDFKHDWWWYANPTFRAIQRERNIRVYGHLQPKNANSLPTLSAISPVNQILSVNPTYRFSLNRMTSLYGTTRIYEIYQRIFTAVGDDVRRDYHGISGTVGSRTLPAANLQDGYHFWILLVKGNGRHEILETTSGIHTNEYNAINEPKSSTLGSGGTTRFLLDRVDPTSTITIGTQAPVPGGIEVTFNNSVRDVLSGLRRTTLHIQGIRGDTSTVVVPTSFTVGAGLQGGPTNPQRVRIPITFTTPRAVYEYYTVTVDAAGNSYRSPTQRFTVPNIPQPPCTPGDPGCPTTTCPPDCPTTCPPDCPTTCPPDCPTVVNPTISALPPLVRKNAPATVSWTIPNGAGTCALSGGSLVDNDGNNSNSGSNTVILSSETTYTITCSGGGSDSITVRVLPEEYET